MSNRYYNFLGMNGSSDINRNELRETPIKDDNKDASPIVIPKKAIKPRKPTVGVLNLEPTVAASASASNLVNELETDFLQSTAASSSKPSAPKKVKPPKLSETDAAAAASNKAGEAAVLAAAFVRLPIPPVIIPMIRQPPNDRERIIQNLRDSFKMTFGGFTSSLLEEEKRVEASDLPIDFIMASVDAAKLFSSTNTNYGSASLVSQLAQVNAQVNEQVNEKTTFETQCKTVPTFDRSMLNTFIEWTDEEKKIKYKSSSKPSESDPSEADSEQTGGPGEARLASRLGSNVNGDSFSYDMVMKISGDNEPKCHKVEVKQLDFPSGSFLTGIKVKKYAELNFFNRINPLLVKFKNLYVDAKRRRFNSLQNMNDTLIRVLSLIEKCFIEGLNEAAEGFFILLNFVLMFLHNIKQQLIRFTFTIDDTPIDLITCYEMYLPLKNRVQNTPNFDEIIGITGSEQIALLLYYLDHEFIDNPSSLQNVLNELLTPFVSEEIKLALVNEQGFMILDDILDKRHSFVVFSRLTRGAIRFKVLGEAYIKMLTSSNEINRIEPVIKPINQEKVLASIFGRIGIMDNLDKMIEENKFLIEQLPFIQEVQEAQTLIELCRNDILQKTREKKALEKANKEDSDSAAFTTPLVKSRSKKAAEVKSTSTLGVKIQNRYNLYF